MRRKWLKIGPWMSRRVIIKDFFRCNGPSHTLHTLLKLQRGIPQWHLTSARIREIYPLAMAWTKQEGYLGLSTRSGCSLSAGAGFLSGKATAGPTGGHPG